MGIGDLVSQTLKEDARNFFRREAAEIMWTRRMAPIKCETRDLFGCGVCFHGCKTCADLYNSLYHDGD